MEWSSISSGAKVTAFDPLLLSELLGPVALLRLVAGALLLISATPDTSSKHSC